jgi:site-specific DNA-methyltransferase (adenine-specific)
MNEENIHSEGFIPKDLTHCFETSLGRLYNLDCLDLFAKISDESVNTIFADPPYNVGVDYGNGLSDAMNESDYLVWMKKWLEESARVLVHGGSIFIYHLPRYSGFISGHLSHLGSTYRNLIVHQRSDGRPIRGKLKPMWYAIIYFSKGTPDRFEPPRRSLATCKRCGQTHKD